MLVLPSEGSNPGRCMTSDLVTGNGCNNQAEGVFEALFLGADRAGSNILTNASPTRKVVSQIPA